MGGGGEGLTPRPGLFVPGKETQNLGRPQGRSDRVRTISLQPEIDPGIYQPVASRCTDCAVPAHGNKIYGRELVLHFIVL